MKCDAVKRILFFLPVGWGHTSVSAPDWSINLNSKTRSSSVWSMSQPKHPNPFDLLLLSSAIVVNVHIIMRPNSVCKSLFPDRSQSRVSSDRGSSQSFTQRQWFISESWSWWTDQSVYWCVYWCVQSHEGGANIQLFTIYLHWDIIIHKLITWCTET